MEPAYTSRSAGIAMQIQIFYTVEGKGFRAPYALAGVFEWSTRLVFSRRGFTYLRRALSLPASPYEKVIFARTRGPNWKNGGWGPHPPGFAGMGFYTEIIASGEFEAFVLFNLWAILLSAWCTREQYRVPLSLSPLCKTPLYNKAKAKTISNRNFSKYKDKDV